MRMSRFLIPTLRESPADAEVISHQLMLRAGYIRSLGSGLYTWMPIGLRSGSVRARSCTMPARPPFRRLSKPLAEARKKRLNERSIS